MKTKNSIWIVVVLVYVAVFAVVILVTGSFKFIIKVTDTNDSVNIDPKNATYEIDGQSVVLVNGLSEIQISPGSASKIITRYFGNDVIGDFNNDSKNDIAFLLTQTTGGTGTFYYVAADLSNGSKSVGTNAILLGDRIAPQNTEFQDGIIIVNYADRQPGESFSTQPTIGLSAFFKIADGKLVDITPR
jgi:hypothetical protein